MEIVNLRSAVLTNFEAKRFLQEQKELGKGKGKEKKEKKKRANKSLMTMCVETINWLETQPASVQVISNKYNTDTSY